jgi:hypothetical protein
MMKTKCDDCGSNRLVECETGSRGGYGPDLLPGTGLFSHAKFTIQVCTQCGRVYWWVSADDLTKVAQSSNFSATRS